MGVRARLPAMIEVQNISKQFGDFTAVDDLSFQLARGDVLGFLGPNGAGKSTTMKMLVGFLRPTRGRIMLDDIDVLTNPLAAQRRIGYLPEGAPAWSEMTPRAFLKFIASIRDLSGSIRVKALGRAIELTSLHGVLDQPIDTLSKGYRRRVGLAQAIMHNPDVLIMDEPTDGLDPNQKAHIRAAIKEMAHRTAIIVSTHILEEVDAICTRAMIIDKGRLLTAGTPAQLAARSRYCGAVEVVVASEAATLIATTLTQSLGESILEVELAPQGTQTRLYAIPKTDSKLTGSAFLLAVQAQLAPHATAVASLALHGGRLDDVFAELTLTESARA